MIDKVRDGKERRVLKRRHLLFYLEISNKSTGEILGHLGDITVDGHVSSRSVNGWMSWFHSPT